MDDFCSTSGDIPVLEYARKKKRRDKWPWWLQAIVEQALIVGLLGLLAMMLIPPMLPSGCGSKLQLAEAAVKPHGAISTALKNFRLDHGRYPDDLNELLKPPPLENDLDETLPYIDPNQYVFQDPWGNTYQYLYPAQRSKEDFDLWSCGPNGSCGDSDDICNW